MIIIISFIYSLGYLVLDMSRKQGKVAVLNWTLNHFFTLFNSFVTTAILLIILKSYIIKKYGNYNSKSFSFSLKYFIYKGLVDSRDIAIYKEFKEYIRNGDIINGNISQDPESKDKSNEPFNEDKKD